MGPRDASAPDLRLAVPTLEPDPAFLAELSEMAAGSGAAGPPAGTMGLGWRTGLAAAGVATVVASSAWMAAAMIGDSDGAPHKPASPITQPAEPRSGERGPDTATRDDSDTDGTADLGQQDRGPAHHKSAETSGTGASQMPAPHGDESLDQQEQSDEDAPPEPEGNTTPEKQDDQGDQGADPGDEADQGQQGYDDPGNDDGSDGLGNDDQGAARPVNDAGAGSLGDNAEQNLGTLDGSND